MSFRVSSQPVAHEPTPVDSSLLQTLPALTRVPATKVVARVITWRNLISQARSCLGTATRCWGEILAVLVGIAGLVAILPGCSGDCGSGKRLVDGVCLAPCETASCDDGLTCVRNVCRPECTSDDQCKASDTCEKVRDDDGTVGRYCYGPALADSPYQASRPEDSNDGGDSQTACKSSAACPQDVPRHCIGGTCETQCSLHQHCGRAGTCSGVAENVEGQMVTFCQSDELPREAGQFGSTCLTSSETCDSANDFMCLSEGEGDTESYCTLRGCDSDDDCPTGLFCSHNRVSSRPPCVSTCGVLGEPQNNNCIPESDIGEGRPYRCSPTAGLELTVCLLRSFCASCETNADCRGDANQICARGPDGNKTCTVECAAGLGSCPWGTATQCGLFDQELGVPTCAPLFGACRGSGKSCEPCVDDADCPNGFCSVSGFTGEQFCFDESASCACEDGEESCVGGGCPLTPSGLRMNCLSPGDGVPPSVCYGAENAVESGMPLGCW